MGILDDAIREHLELKRSHGAPADEIKQKEAEAFGPVRSDAAPVATEPVAAEPELAGEETQLMAPAELEPLEPAPEDPYAVHPGDELVPDEQDVAPAPAPPPVEEHEAPPVAEAGGQMLEPHRVEPGPPTPPEHHHEERHPALDTDPFGHEVHPPEPVFRQSADAPLRPAPEDPYVGDPAYERPETEEPPPRQSPEEAEAHEVGDFEPKEEDVLEETPEFLQDAPEHDRLWFEQKPPRDFDFGE
jgi:hypothetical protein